MKSCNLNHFCQKTICAILFTVLFGISFVSFGQTTVTIGSGTQTNQRQPLGNWYGYERSVMLYTASEIGTAGTITKIAFNGQNSLSHPVKIYMSMISSENLANNTVDNFKASMTQVNNGTAGTFTGWGTFTLSSSFFYDGHSSLLVLVENDYGGSGSSNGNTPNTYSSYTTQSNDKKFIYWQQDGSAPTGNGTTSTQRPDIRLTITPICHSSYTNYCSVDQINKVKLIGETVTLDNNTGCESSNFGNYTNTTSVPDLKQGSNYSITVANTASTNYNNNYVAIWIDYNNNGTFESGELIATTDQTSFNGSSSKSWVVSIPAGATLGKHTMRVKLVGHNPNWTGSISPCGAEDWGETEDYTVEIINQNTTGWPTFTAWFKAEENVTTSTGVSSWGNSGVQLEVIP